MTQVTMSQLFDNSVHIGHNTTLRNPFMKDYIFGASRGLNIINLDCTLEMLNNALEQVTKIVLGGGTVQFVATKTFAKEIVKEQAQRCGMPFVTHRWLGGMLTNYTTIRKSLTRLNDLENMLADEKSLAGYKKREKLSMMRQRDKLNLSFEGVKDQKGLPDALFVVDVKTESIAVAEAKRLGIPVFAMVDTNSDPRTVPYPIPANDDSYKSIALIAGAFADTIISAKENANVIANEHAVKTKIERAKKLTEQVETKQVQTAPKAEPKVEAAPAKDDGQSDNETK